VEDGEREVRSRWWKWEEMEGDRMGDLSGCLPGFVKAGCEHHVWMGNGLARPT
jgi:hypothetical protein